MGKHSFSLKVANQETAGFGPNDVDVEIVDCYWGKWQEAGEKALVNGRDADDPALVITFKGEDGNDYAPVLLGAGKGSKSQPSETGEDGDSADRGPYLCKASEDSKGKGVHQTSKSGIFLASLVKPKKGKIKFDDDLLDYPNGGVANLIGMKLHVCELPAPNQPAPAEGERARTNLVCTEIFELGSGKKSKAKKVTKKDEDEDDEKPAKKSSKPAADDDDDDEDGEDAISTAAEAAVVKILDANDGSVKATDLVKKGFKFFKGDKKADIIELVQDEDWVNDDERPWTVSKGVLKAVEADEEEE